MSYPTPYNIKQGINAVLGDLSVQSLTIRGNSFVVTADMTSATWNTVAAHEIAVVTGLVRVQIVARVTDTVITTGTNGTIVLGWEGATTSMIGSTLADALVTNELWYDTSPTTVGDTFNNAVLDFVVNGADIGYTIGTNAATAGEIEFLVFWVPLSSGATVTAGAGGTFA